MPETPKLTDRQQQILDLVQSAIERTGAPPTRAEIAAELGFRSANAAEEHLQALARKGVIELVGGTSRGIRLQSDTLRALNQARGKQFSLPLPRPLLAVGNETVPSTPNADASSTAKRRFKTSAVSPPPLVCVPSGSVRRAQASVETRTPQSGVNPSLSVTGRLSRFEPSTKRAGSPPASTSSQPGAESCAGVATLGRYGVACGDSSLPPSAACAPAAAIATATHASRTALALTSACCCG